MTRPTKRQRLDEWLLSGPSVLWLAALFVIPSGIVFAMAFRSSDPYGGIGAVWTLDTLRQLANAHYLAIGWRTVWLSFATTVLCLLLAVPCGYSMARASPRWRSIFLLLIIVPFWTSSLIRIFAWKVLLHPDGLIRQALVLGGLLDPSTLLLYRPGAVLMVMVYTYLPFAILPIYAAAEKFDYGLLEAARDLGASSRQAFARVFMPGVRRGIVTATLVVFIPALGSYVIPDLVGGPNSEMIGNKIAQRTFVDRNLPHASALAALLTLAVMAPLVAALVLHGRKDRREQPLFTEDA